MLPGFLPCQVSNADETTVNRNTGVQLFLRCLHLSKLLSHGSQLLRGRLVAHLPIHDLQLVGNALVERCTIHEQDLERSLQLHKEVST